MIDLQITNQPDHYIKGRSIQPIDVIEDWGLCHHLSCVVKYLARCGRKQDAHQDLLKARWYLTRKIALLTSDLHKSLLSVTKEDGISLTAVLLDWNLTSNLEFVLSYIKPSQLRGSRVSSLNQALIYLQEEIQTYEGRRYP